MGSPGARKPAREGNQVKEKRGFIRVLSSKVKTALRSGGESSSKRLSTAPRMVEASQAEPEQGQTSRQTGEVEPTSTAKPEYEGAKRIPRSQVYEERTQKLGARFGMEFNPNDWYSMDGDVLRVEKPVRVRIRRECHQCHTIFGPSNACSQCSHVRCSQCPRYPPKRTEAEKEADREKRKSWAKKDQEMSAVIVPHYCFAEPIVLKRPSKTGGQDLVYKKPRMRSRRHCHQCEGLFAAGSRVCENCKHQRCGDCPRYPAKKKTYPFGYPNDEPGASQPTFHSCHECENIFPPNTEEGTGCSKCSHSKCSNCPNVIPRKISPNYDPEMLRNMEALSVAHSL